MMNFLHILFFVFPGLIVYSYVCYPFFLRILAFIFCRKKKQNTDERPVCSVSIVMAMYNEEKILSKKLKSLTDLEFVARDAANSYSHIEVLIGSDASTDASDDIVRECANRYPFIRLIRFPGRTGKASIINQLVDMAKGDIIISTDANVIFSRRLLNELLFPFRDSNVGMVAANIIRSTDPPQGMQEVEKNYIKRENTIKKIQSCVSGILMGVEGGCYAIRKNLFAKVPKGYFMDDFFITMSVIRKGYNISFAEAALCYEDIPDDRSEEFKRKTRISIGNYQNMVHYRGMLFNPFHRVFFHFISHKFIRWITPFLLILTAILGWILSFYDKLYLYPTLFLTFLLLLPVAGRWVYSLPLLRYAAHFVYMNYALLKGFFLYLKKTASSVWKPTMRASEETIRS